MVNEVVKVAVDFRAAYEKSREYVYPQTEVDDFYFVRDEYHICGTFQNGHCFHIGFIENSWFGEVADEVEVDICQFNKIESLWDAMMSLCIGDGCTDEEKENFIDMLTCHMWDEMKLDDLDERGELDIYKDEEIVEMFDKWVRSECAKRRENKIPTKRIETVIPDLDDIIKEARKKDSHRSEKWKYFCRVKIRIKYNGRKLHRYFYVNEYNEALDVAYAIRKAFVARGIRHGWLEDCDDDGWFTSSIEDDNGVLYELCSDYEDEDCIISVVSGYYRNMPKNAECVYRAYWKEWSKRMGEDVDDDVDPITQMTTKEYLDYVL